jgi:DNA invertase Pin-like site-specific DNA recombinase
MYNLPVVIENPSKAGIKRHGQLSPKSSKVNKAEPPMKTYAYCRVSTADQNECRQLDALAEIKIPTTQILTEKKSGKNFKRPAWEKMTKLLNPGDLIYVHSIDRLGRNYEDILTWWRILTKEKGVDIIVLDMPLLNTLTHKDLLGTLISDLVLSLLSYVAHKERDNIKTRRKILLKL